MVQLLIHHRVVVVAHHACATSQAAGSSIVGLDQGAHPLDTAVLEDGLHVECQLRRHATVRTRHETVIVQIRMSIADHCPQAAYDLAVFILGHYRDAV